MCRVLLTVGLVLSLAGCCLPERKTLQMLPANVVLPYAELLDRAKTQVNLATEAFYVDDWLELTQAGVALEQTARLFPKSPDIPKTIKKELPQKADELAADVKQLLKDAKARDAKAANVSLQNLHLKLREFYVANGKK